MVLTYLQVLECDPGPVGGGGELLGVVGQTYQPATSQAGGQAGTP